MQLFRRNDKKGLMQRTSAKSDYSFLIFQKLKLFSCGKRKFSGLVFIKEMGIWQLWPFRGVQGVKTLLEAARSNQNLAETV